MAPPRRTVTLEAVARQAGFVAGATVVHDDVRYTAKWWTRGQAPGDPNGPWKRIN